MLTLRVIPSCRSAFTPGGLIGLMLVLFSIYMSILFFNATVLDHDTYQRIYLAQRGEWNEHFVPSWDVHKLHDRIMYSIWEILFWFPEDSRAILSAKILTHLSAWSFVILSVFLSTKYSQNRNVRLLWIFFASVGAPGLFFMVAKAEDNVTYYPFLLLFIHFLVWPHFKSSPTKTVIKFACMSGFMLAICIQITTICALFLVCVASVPILLLFRRKELAMSILVASISSIIAYQIMDLLLFGGTSRSLATFITHASNTEIVSPQNRMSLQYLRLLYRGLTTFLFLGLSERWGFPTSLMVVSVISYRLLWIWIALSVPFLYRALKLDWSREIQQVFAGLSVIVAISLIPPLTIEWYIERWDFLWISGLMLFMITMSLTVARLKKNQLTPYIRILVYVTIATQIFWSTVNVLSEAQIVLKNRDFEKVKASIYEIRHTKSKNVILPVIPFEEFHSFTRAALPDRRIFYCELSRSQPTDCFQIGDKLNERPVSFQIQRTDIQTDRSAWWIAPSFRF